MSSESAKDLTDQEAADVFNEFAKTFDAENGLEVDKEEIVFEDDTEGKKADENKGVIEHPASAPEQKEPEFDFDSLPEAAKKRIQDLEHTIKSDDGRVGALQKKLDAQQKQLEQLQQRGDGNSKEAKKLEEAIDKGEIDLGTLLEELPELGPLVTELKTLRERMNGVHSVINEQVITPAQAKAAKDAEAIEFEVLISEHPDFKEIESNPDFWSWVDGQHQAIKNLVESDSAGDVSAVMSLYKKMNPGSAPKSPPPAQKIQRNVDDLIALPSDGNGRSTSASGDADALWSHWAKQADEGKI